MLSCGFGAPAKIVDFGYCSLLGDAGLECVLAKVLYHAANASVTDF